jgi:hypothetical protein
MPWPRRDVIVEDAQVLDASPRVLRRLAVAWQHPVTRAIEPVGILECDEAGYRFRYVRNALRVEGFRPLLGFPDLHRTYESTRLFPLFAQRVMDARRPDYRRMLGPLSFLAAQAVIARVTPSSCAQSQSSLPTGQHAPSSW